jgi:hypothetical protein
LQDVARHVGDCAIHLGLELGLEMTAIEDTLVSYQNDMKGQILDVMTKWKSSSEVKTFKINIILIYKFYDKIEEVISL